MRETSVVIVAMLLTGILTVTVNVQPVKSDYAWTEPIYIRADGRVQPSTAPISSFDNVTFTLTDNIAGNVPANSSAIIIQRDNVIMDGAGHTLRGTQAAASEGIVLTGRSNVTIKNMNITGFSWGIFLNSSNNNSVGGNNITNNAFGIELDSSSSNGISGNNIANNWDGIELDSSSSNGISGNNITANKGDGIGLGSSSINNNVSGNSFVNDGLFVYDSFGNMMADNLVNGKPLVYLEDVSDYAVGDAGQVILFKCNNITVENLNLSNTTIGVELSETNNTAISGNNITVNNYGGIVLGSSYNNSVSGNNITNNIANNINKQYGILLVSSSSNGVSRNNIASNAWGIYLDSSSNNSVNGNNIANNWDGIGLFYSSNNNNASGNNITNNGAGIWLDSSYNNSVSGNNITASAHDGIVLVSSSNNTIYHTDFINNAPAGSQVYSLDSTNVWDNGYPSGGNYWSNYPGTDRDGDGIGDTPYVIDANNTDRYPLMASYGMFDAGTWNETACSVGVMSNSTVSEFQVDVAQKTLSFNVTGAEGSAGFCRVTIPNIIVQNLWQGNYTLLVDGKPWLFTNWTDATSTYVYFNYTHSQHQTVIAPEFPSLLILPMLMILTLLAIVASRRKWPKHQTGSPQHPRTAQRRWPIDQNVDVTLDAKDGALVIRRKA
jgi:parallel beta-helix repeat protein